MWKQGAALENEFDIVAVGGGTAGLVTAAGAAYLGARVALVERERLGGDRLWTGCVPSKALLASARHAHGLGIAALSNTMFPYPTRMEAWRRAADGFRRAQLDMWKGALLRKVVRSWT